MKISKLAAFAIAAIMSVHAAVPSAAATGQGIRPTPFGKKSTFTTASVKQGGSAKKKGFSVSLSDTEYVYNGKKRKPRVVVRHGSSILSRSDYKVSYGHGRRRVGTYSVTVKLRRNYSGKLVTAFTILPKATCINSIKSTDDGPLCIKVKLKKRSHADGYEVQYSTDSRFKSDNHVLVSRGYSNNKVSVKNSVSPRKTYYVRARVYETSKGKTYYSAWSSISSVTVPASKNAKKSKSVTSPVGYHGFSKHTEMTVSAHMNDFTYNTFDTFMARHGGAAAYVRSLGGVFAKYCGKNVQVKTAGQFQEVAEYVMGIMTIWGPDYHGGGGDHKFNGYWGKGSQYGRFYAGQKVSRHWRCKPFEKVYFYDKEHIMTDCGCGCAYIMNKAGLLPDNKYAGTEKKSTAWRKVNKSKGGTVITKKEDLQVGDLVQMSKTKSESGWKHVCVVGEVYPDGTIITYDTGNRYVNTANYKKSLVFKKDGTLGGDYNGYKSWFGMRIRALDQSDSLAIK